jgi:P pilus assembly chaperone PapD
MTIDYTNDLNEFCTKYKIQLVGNYTNVKNTTPIYFNCKHCNFQVKKSYKLLTKYKDNDNIAGWSSICDKCFRNSMH